MTVAVSEFGEPATQAAGVIELREPCNGPDTIVNVSSQVSASEPLKVMTRAVSSEVETVWGAAVGLALTVTVTLAAAEAQPLRVTVTA